MESVVNDALITGVFLGIMATFFLMIGVGMLNSVLKRREDRVSRLEDDILSLKQFKRQVEMDQKFARFEKTGEI